MNIFICYKDPQILVVWKPSGMLVHPSEQASDTTTLMSLTRNQIGRRVYPVHRLDRQTSGMVLFGRSPEAAAAMSLQFRMHTIKKGYLTLVRGHLADNKRFIDYPVRAKRDNRSYPAQSVFCELARCTKPWAIGPYPESRYSLVHAQPVTGRRHQLRKHLAHLRHPIIGDRYYGDTKHNAFFRNETPWSSMMLSSIYLEFISPENQVKVKLLHNLDERFKSLIKDFFEMEVTAIGNRVREEME